MTAAAPTLFESSTAWHGVDRSDSPPAARGLPLDSRGRLKNGNRSGDFLAAPRCGARTRCGGKCCQPAMSNGRCRLHGGLSTGPRTPEGLARSRRARWKHGARSAEVRALRRGARAQFRRVRTILSGVPAGHGVHRSNSRPTPRLARAKVNRRDAEAPRCHGSGLRGVSPASSNRLCERSSRDRLPLNSITRPNNPNSASLRLCVSAVHLASPAWHGVLRSFRDRLCASASLSTIRHVLRSPAPTNR